MMTRWMCLALIAGCASFEPLDRPDDLAEAGMPVGVQTMVVNGQDVAIWYPASDNTEGSTSVIDLADHLDPAFLERVPELTIPTINQPAVVDADVRRLEEPVPLVVFSHGLGGFHSQSATLTAHLASRGYVVVSADHPGRRLRDVVGCLLTPPAGPCDLGPLAGAGDPGPEDVADVLDGLEAALPEALAGIIDFDTIGMFGHSAGGGTTTTFASDDTRIDAALVMAGGGAFTRDFPTLTVAGSCDAVVETEALIEANATSEGYAVLVDAGHLAFSDLCTVDLGALAAQIGERDDANALIIGGLTALATDGCPTSEPNTELSTCDAESFLPLATSDAILFDMVPRFFDATLRGEGDAVDVSAFADVDYTP